MKTEYIFNKRSHNAVPGIQSHHRKLFDLAQIGGGNLSTCSHDIDGLH